MGLANWLTIVRILLIPVFVTLLVYDRVVVGLGTFVLAGMTDTLDGYIARRRGTATRLGAFLDPLADKLLLTSAFITLTYRFPHVLPFWVTAIVLSRDGLMVLVAALIMLTGGRVHPEPSRLGKTSTAVQMVTVGAALLVVAGVDGLAPVLLGLTWLTAALTLASGLQYLRATPRYVDWGTR